MAVPSRSFSHYLFVDESGDIAQRNTAHVITCVVVTTDRHIPSRIVRSTRNQYRTLRPENRPLHASDNEPSLVRYLLNLVASDTSISVVAGILDRRYLLESPNKRNELYGRLVAFTIGRAFTTLEIPTASAHVAIEQSYTKGRLNRALTFDISDAVKIAPSQVAIVSKTDAEWGRGLQVADYVAWSMYQQYERHDGEFVEMIRKRIVCEEVVGSRDGQIRPIGDFWV